MKIIIDIDVTNPEEVIKAHKGQLMGLLSGMVMSKESKRKRINLAVCTEIIKVIEKELPVELEKELVEASISLQIVDSDERRDEELYT